jgi:hypothetical protein
MKRNKVGLAGLVLGSVLALVVPQTAAAKDRDDHYRYNDGYGYSNMSPHERHEIEEHRRHEEHERMERLRRERRYYNNGYYNDYNAPRSNGYYAPQGYYDQYGNWHQ